MENVFIQRSDDYKTQFRKIDWFCAPGSHLLMGRLTFMLPVFRRLTQVYSVWMRKNIAALCIQMMSCYKQVEQEGWAVFIRKGQVCFLLFSSLLFSSLFLFSLSFFLFLLYSTLLYSTLLYSTLLYSTLYYSTRLVSCLHFLTFLVLFSSLIYSYIVSLPHNVLFYCLLSLVFTCLSFSHLVSYLLIMSCLLSCLSFVLLWYCLSRLSSSSLRSARLKGCLCSLWVFTLAVSRGHCECAPWLSPECWLVKWSHS